MLTSIDVKFLSFLAGFLTNSGFKGMFSLADILQVAALV